MNDVSGIIDAIMALTVAEYADLMRRLRGELGDDDGLAGVREPRTPPPSRPREALQVPCEHKGVHLRVMPPPPHLADVVAEVRICPACDAIVDHRLKR